MLVEHHPSHLN
jgi:hypothetical protein